MKTTVFITFFTVFILHITHAQTVGYKTWNPAADIVKVLGGQGWPQQVKNYYDRLPAKAEQTVRKEVWDLSHHTAGLFLKFRTNADEIIVKYAVGGNLQMP